MTVLRKHAPVHMTVSEFLSWDAEDPTGVPWQLIDGEPLAMAPGSETHAALQAEIGALLRNHLLEKGSSCRLRSQPGIVPRIRSDQNWRVPDLGITCAPPSRVVTVSDTLTLDSIGFSVRLAAFHPTTALAV